MPQAKASLPMNRSPRRKLGPTPQVVLQPPTNSLNKFTQKDNRDIFGNDILLTEGKTRHSGDYAERVRSCL